MQQQLQAALFLSLRLLTVHAMFRERKITIVLFVIEQLCSAKITFFSHCIHCQMLAKRDAEQEKAVLQWISALTGATFAPEADYVKVLRDGQALCKLMNAIQPGIISKIHATGPDFKMLENVNR